MSTFSKFLSLVNAADRTVDLSLSGSALGLNDLQLLGSTSGTLDMIASATTTSYSLTWPAAQGSANTYLKNDGSGNLSWATVSAGGVISVALSDGSTTPIYAISGSPVTSSGTLTFTLDTQSANSVFAGPTSGSAAQPTFRALVSADIPNNAANTTGTASNITATSNSTLTTLSSLSLPTSQLTGDINLTSQVSGILPYANGGTNANTSFTQGSVIFAGASALSQDNSQFFWDDTNHRLGIGTASPAYTLQVSSVPATGTPQILVLNTGTQSATAGGFIGAGANNGSAMSSGNRLGAFIGLGWDGAALRGAGGMSILAAQNWSSGVAGSQLLFKTNTNGGTTQSNALLIDQNQQITMFAYGAGVAQFSSAGLISSTAPGTSGNVLTSNGTAWVSSAPASSGTVTSVALADGSTSPIYTISGSPVTSSGTLTFTLSTQSANTVFAGPSTGSAAQPAFRALVAADIPSLSSIYLPLSGGTMTGAINGGGFQASNFANPTTAQALATKAYVDAAISGLTWQGPAKAYAASNVPLTGGATLTIDGYSVQNGDLVILGNQTTAAQNGEYTASGIGTTYVLTANGLPSAAGDAWLILNGTVYSDSAFVANAAVPSATFTEFAGPTAYTFNSPLSLSGNTVSVVLAANEIFVGNGSNVATAVALSGDATIVSSGAITLATVNSNVGSFGSSTSIPSFTVNAKGLITAASGNAVVAPAGTLSGTTLNSTVVSSSLTSVGTITTGVWNGTAVAIGFGGTGQATKQAGFDALSPLGTAGDTLYYNGSHNVNLAIGTTGQVLTVVSGEPAWASPASVTVTAVYGDSPTLTANTTYAMRWGMPDNSETAGKLYLADWNTATRDYFWVEGLYSGISVATGATITIVTKGPFTSTDLSFSSSNQGRPAYLGSSGAVLGYSTFNSTVASGDANEKVGMVTGASTISVGPQMMGVS